MPLRRAKATDTLYTEVEDYDLVIVPDAPFASALNRRLDRPHFGNFAITPRRLAAGRREQAEDQLAFLEVIDRTDHDWQAVAYAIRNVLQCWEQQGRLGAILEYDAYVDETTREVVDIMGDLRTTSQQLTEYTIDDEQSVAVVGYDQLTTLERTILPEEFDRIEPFTDESFDYPAFHVFESSTDIVTALIDTITTENAEHVAVILDSGSEYSSLVESALETANIPFYGGPGFVDDPHHRAFVRLLRLGFRGPETTVGDIRPVLTQLGIDVPIDHNEKRLESIDADGIDWVQEFCASLDERTFADALSAYATKAGTEFARFDDELRELGIADDLVTSDDIDRLAYYLQAYEVPIDRTNEGVFLADAKSSAYVDRSSSISEWDRTGRTRLHSVSGSIPKPSSNATSGTSSEWQRPVLSRSGYRRR